MGPLNPVLLLAVMFVVLLGAIPRRYWYLQLPAVVGWVLVWVDNQFTAHWTDVLGLAVTALSLMWLAVNWTPSHDERRDR